MCCFVGKRIETCRKSKFRLFAGQDSKVNRQQSIPVHPQHLGKTDPTAVKGAIASLEDRVASLEGKLAGLGQLVGE